MIDFDEDVVVVGLGFGGFVVVLWFVEKGYCVQVYEVGCCFEDEDFV